MACKQGQRNTAQRSAAGLAKRKCTTCTANPRSFSCSTPHPACAAWLVLPAASCTAARFILSHTLRTRLMAHHDIYCAAGSLFPHAGSMEQHKSLLPWVMLHPPCTASTLLLVQRSVEQRSTLCMLWTQKHHPPPTLRSFSFFSSYSARWAGESTSGLKLEPSHSSASAPLPAGTIIQGKAAFQ